jgi:asparagine synthase (glutamine-hydrolysing)
MRRLSIIDLDGGRQPLFNETGDIAVVCNGEIYNFRELRAELESRGHRFSSDHSDVETIVHAYEEYGDDFVSHLRGMFAFALWDRNRQCLILARDRLGEKPLYYHQDSAGRFWFSSELRSLFHVLEQPPRLTPKSVNLFVAFQYLPEPATPIEEIKQLPAGHCLVLTRERLDAQPKPYWDLMALRESADHPVEKVKQALDEACRLMSTADVPVAVALSGGIDSSLVAAITAKHYKQDLHAFTIGYEGRPSMDERSQAEDMAKTLGIGFTEVELSNAQVIEEFPRMMAAMDTPIADIAAYGYYSVSKAARDAGYPVLLSGLGGDEFFWGYEWVREAVKRNESYIEQGLVETRDFFEVHEFMRGSEAQSRALMSDAALAQMEPGMWLKENSLDADLPVYMAVTKLLNRTWLQSNCLALMDRMSMANSVETRLPLLDVELVRKVTGMRNAGMEDWNQPHKALLIQALGDTLSEEILQRKKQGFTPPYSRWREGIVKRFGGLLIDGSLVRQELLDSGRVSAGLQKYDAAFLHTLVVLECWSRLHIDGETAESLLSGAPLP